MSGMNLESLRQHLASLNARMPMREIALLPDFYGIPAGTLSAIKNGRDPKDPITRARLGLDPLPTCGQCWRFNKYIKRAARKPKRWRDMPVKVLRAALENRVEYP